MPAAVQCAPSASVSGGSSSSSRHSSGSHSSSGRRRPAAAPAAAAVSQRVGRLLRQTATATATSSRPHPRPLTHPTLARHPLASHPSPLRSALRAALFGPSLLISRPSAAHPRPGLMPSLPLTHSSTPPRTAAALFFAHCLPLHLLLQPPECLAPPHFPSLFFTPPAFVHAFALPAAAGRRGPSPPPQRRRRRTARSPHALGWWRRPTMGSALWWNWWIAPP